MKNLGKYVRKKKLEGWKGRVQDTSREKRKKHGEGDKEILPESGIPVKKWKD
jgi:hypothetical protein